MTETITLTPSQRSEWDKVLTALTFQVPALNHLMYSLLDRTDAGDVAVFTNQIPLAATDGKCMLLNPDTFFSKDLTLKHRLLITCHEIFHNVFEHIVLGYRWQVTKKVAYPDGTSLPYDAMLMNKAMDYIVNATLLTAKIGEMPTGQWQGLYDPAITADGDADLLDVYRKLHKRQKAQGQSKPCNGGQGGQGKPGQSTPAQGEGDKDHGGGFCQHQDLGSTKGDNPHEVASKHNSQQVQTAIAAAANAARLMGKLPAGLERILKKLLTPTVDWREHVRALLMRKAGSGGYDWQKADEELILRDIYAPQRSGHGIGTVVCVIDNSGSVSQADYDLFYGNVAGMLDDLKPKRLHVIWCDREVHKSVEIDNAMELVGLKVNGGGGTDFRPAFAEVERLGLKPDAMIYLTDGLGDFPQQAPDWHVIWGSIYEPAKYPFGDVVQVPRQTS